MIPLTSIITVNFHQNLVTIDLLKSIAQHYNKKEVEIIIVDNECLFNQEEIFKPYFDNIKYINSPTNLGFAGGNNLGIKMAVGEYIFLLNNDTEIPGGCMETLIVTLENNPKIGLLSPLLLYFDQKNMVQYAGFTPLNYLTGRNAYIGQYEENSEQFHQIYPIGFCHGAAIICRKKDLEQAGLMDENYFLYYEEFDWCEKFKRIGKEIWFCGKTYVYHKESISVGKASPLKVYFNTRNRMLFIRKNTGWINTLFFFFYFSLIACPKAIIKYSFKGQFKLAYWSFRGLLWNYLHGKNSKNIGFKINFQ